MGHCLLCGDVCQMHPRQRRHARRALARLGGQPRLLEGAVVEACTDSFCLRAALLFNYTHTLLFLSLTLFLFCLQIFSLYISL